jgi:hypothetical protein
MLWLYGCLSVVVAVLVEQAAAGDNVHDKNLFEYGEHVLLLREILPNSGTLIPYPFNGPEK